MNGGIPIFQMGGGDPYDPSSMAKTLSELYVRGIDAGRAIRDAEARRDGQAAYGSGFKQGFDEGKKQSGETIARMANELLTYKIKYGENRVKGDTQKKCSPNQSQKNKKNTRGSSSKKKT